MNKIGKSLLSPAPRAAVYVWALAGGIFAIFAMRLLIASTFVHGLPHQSSFITYWAFVAAFFILSAAWPSRAAFVFLCFLPILSSLDVLAVGPCWKQHEVALAALFFGWVLRFFVSARRKKLEITVIDFWAGCIALCFGVGSIYALSHPSWSNSVSVAFSWAFWPEKTEFAALTTGYAYMAGAFIYATLRLGCKDTRELTARTMLVLVCIQLTLSLALAVGDALMSEGSKVAMESTRAYFRLPFGPVHSLAGPAVMFAGFFIGVAMFSWMHGMRSARWFLLLAASGALLATLSFSKAAWIGLFCLVAIGFRVVRGWRGFVWVVVLGIGLFAAVRVFIPDNTTWLTEQMDLMMTPKLWLENQATVLERLGIWGNALIMMFYHPLAGVGVGNYSSLMEHYSWYGFIGSKRWGAYADPVESTLDAMFPQDSFNGYHAHNDFLEIATGMGIPTALLFATVLVGFLWIGWAVVKCKSNSSEARLFGCGAVFAFAGYAFVGLIDSRLASFIDSVIFWQLGAGIVAVALSQSYCASSKVSSAWHSAALAAPALLIIGAITTMGTGNLPRSQSYGIWNWHLQEGEDVFLLAREAQFVIPPEERLEALEFRVPKSAGFEAMNLLVLADQKVVSDVVISTEKPANVNVTNIRKLSEWPVITVRSERWAGRGALGTSLGIKPYAVEMRKIRATDLK